MTRLKSFWYSSLQSSLFIIHLIHLTVCILRHLFVVSSYYSINATFVHLVLLHVPINHFSSLSRVLSVTTTAYKFSNIFFLIGYTTPLQFCQSFPPSFMQPSLYDKTPLYSFPRVYFLQVVKGPIMTQYIKYDKFSETSCFYHSNGK